MAEPENGGDPAAGIGGLLGQLVGGTIQQTFGYGAGTALGSAMEPLAQEERNRLWPLDPNVPLTPDILAAMVVQGVMEESAGAEEARMSGISPERFHKLYRVNGSPIAPEEALALWNRGEISEDDVNRALVQSRLKPEWVTEFKKLRKQLLQSAELAEMSVQGILTEQEGAEKAALLGINAEEFHLMHLLAGNPPGPQDTLSLWNRGIINEGEATRALMQSRLKPEWIETVKESRIRPATTMQAVEAVVKQRITFDEGAAIAHQNGASRETFQLLVNAAGRPIGIGQALTLFNRGVFQRADVEEVVARSNVRTEYTDAILHLAVRYPPLFQISRLIASGAVNDKDAINLITDQGYPRKLAEGIVKAAHTTKVEGHRDLTVAEIQSLYQQRGLKKADAIEMLKQLHFDQREAGLILALADARRIAHYIEAVIGRVHAQFINHRIDERVVQEALDKAGVPADQRETLIDLWIEERAANVKILTPSQIHQAYKRAVLTIEQATKRLVQQGYSADDAAILLAI